MSRHLKRRIANAGQVSSQAMAANHPYGTAATPMTMPLASVTYVPVPGYPWGTAVYQELHPVWTADGAMIPALPPRPAVKTPPAGRA